MSTPASSADSDTVFVISPDISLADLHKMCAAVATHLREGLQRLLETNKDTDKLVLWLAGLMGAGIFSAQRLLTAAPQYVRLVTQVPWMLGVLTAMFGLLVSNELQALVTREHLARAVVADMLQFSSDRSYILQTINPLLRWASESEETGNKTMRRLSTAANAAFYLTAIFLAVGIVAAGTTIMVWGTR
jgi:hypothetical protein